MLPIQERYKLGTAYNEISEDAKTLQPNSVYGSGNMPSAWQRCCRSMRNGLLQDGSFRKARDSREAELLLFLHFGSKARFK
jgi:hypothetical protein